METRRLLSVKETAIALNLSPWTIRKYVSQRKEIPFVKAGGRRTMFDVRDIEKYIERQKFHPKEEDEV